MSGALALHRDPDASPEAIHRDEWLSSRTRAPRWPMLGLGALALAALIGWALPREPSANLLPGRGASSPDARALPNADDDTTDVRLQKARESAREGDLNAALLRVQDLLDVDPRDAQALQALVDIHDRAARPTDALGALERLQALEPNQDRQRQVIERRRQLGQPEQAMHALEGLVHGLKAGSSAEHLALAPWQLQRGPEALRRLSDLPGGAASPTVLQQRVVLALEIDRMDAAVQALRQHGAQPVPSGVLVAMAASALADERRDRPVGARRDEVLRLLWTAPWQQGLERADPLLAARVALAVGDPGAFAPLADAAQVRCSGHADCAVDLAALNHQQGRLGQAASALKLADEAGPMAEGRLRDYVRVALATHHAQEGLAKLERQRRALASKAFTEAWLLLATGAGAHDSVTAWLLAHAGEPVADDDVLRDVMRMAVDARAHALTAAVGESLPARAITAAELVQMAQAQWLLDRQAESLATWRRVHARTDAYRDLYAQAMARMPASMPGLPAQAARR